MAVYRGMDIGTAKPSAEERAGVRVHMIDLVEPSEDFTVREFQDAARVPLSPTSNKEENVRCSSAVRASTSARS